MMKFVQALERRNLFFAGEIEPDGPAVDCKAVGHECEKNLLLPLGQA